MVEERPSAIYKVVLDTRQEVLAHLVGTEKRNFVRLVPGDNEEVELSPHDRRVESRKLKFGERQRFCDKCKVINREGVVRVICVNPKHKQRQGEHGTYCRC